MAKQTVNIGSAVNDSSGDPARTAFNKLNQNDNELYAALGANPQGVLPVQPSLTKYNEWQAAQRIKTGYPSLQLESTNGDYGTLLETAGAYPMVLVRPKTSMASSAGQIASFGFPEKTGSHILACTSDITGMLVKGNYGIGARSTDGVLANSNLNSLPNDVGFEARIQNQSVNGTTANNYPVGGSYGAIIRYDSDTHGFQQFYLAGGTKIYTRTKSSGSYGAWVEYRTTGNTTVDSNGFIKNASPIVNLFADRIELNDEAKQQQDIEFEKLGIGDYLVKGSTGFSQDGWYIETPKDANGNVLFSVIYTTLENGDISVKTYKKKFDLETASIVADLSQPVDITANRWIDLRLQELPKPEIEVTDDPEQ